MLFRSSSKGPTYDNRIKPDLSAQGVRVLLASTSGNPNTYVRANGTSFSCPLVAGVAACLIQARPTWPPTLIIQALKRTASNAATPDTLVGWGVPDGLAALRYRPDTLGAPGGPGPLALAFSGPNPMLPGQATHVRFALDAGLPASHYRLRVFDAAGRVVRDLGEGSVAPGGIVDRSWSGDDAHGRAVTPGVYLMMLDAGGQQRSARVVVLR